MTQEEYKIKKAAINKKAEDELKELSKEYAFSNNVVKLNDILEDHNQRGRVTDIKYISRSMISQEMPTCVYMCVLVNKDGTETKRKFNETIIYQSNLKSINNENIS